MKVEGANKLVENTIKQSHSQMLLHLEKESVSFLCVHIKGGIIRKMKNRYIFNKNM